MNQEVDMSDEGTFSDMDADPGAEDPFRCLCVSRANTMDEIEEKHGYLITQVHPIGGNYSDRLDGDTLRQAKYSFDDALDGIDTSDLKDELKLSISPKDPSLEVGEEVEFEVIDQDGDPAVKALLIEEGGQQIETNPDGRAAMSFDGAGEKRMKAELEDIPPERYETDETTVQVKKTTSELHITGYEDPITVVEEASFRVLDEHGDPVEGASVQVRADETERSTDADGRVSFSLSGIGTIEVSADKEDTADRSWLGDSVQVEIEREEISLSIEASADTVRQGERTEVFVTGEGDTIPGAVVRTSDGEETRTNETGRAELELRTPGETEITARKEGDDLRKYTPASTAVNVEEIVKKVDIEDYEDEVESGEEAKIVVVDERRSRLEGARVTTDDGHVEYTDEDGEASITFEDTGWKHVNISMEEEYFKETDDCYINVTE